MVMSDSDANLGLTGSNETTKSLWFKSFCKLKNGVLKFTKTFES